jgi:hypothetical protein
MRLVGSGPGKEGARFMWRDDEPVAQPESQGIPGKEDLELADEVYIPDYVMLDFGTPEATRTDR